MKFRKKPVVIEAVQWTGNNLEEIRQFTQNIATYSSLSDLLIIPTLEGNMTAIPTDWIIKGVKGEFYPCKNDIFEQTYEKVD
jgi:hypothetical protein